MRSRARTGRLFGNFSHAVRPRKADRDFHDRQAMKGSRVLYQIVPAALAMLVTFHLRPTYVERLQSITFGARVMGCVV